MLSAEFLTAMVLPQNGLGLFLFQKRQRRTGTAFACAGVRHWAGALPLPGRARHGLVPAAILRENMKAVAALLQSRGRYIPRCVPRLDSG